ncbi:aminoglycoside phosphotransferase (APT) family kinase protein [Kineococcus radiotolerans]|uniref:Aminoglycoside phosphotransferase (APT) family kinase protein n=1 Tax=Kineococcus radiotolerans TaxID=131568 RepID=A0A7W4TR02_KINRA|nr:aminoglycoside phosphotransferase family protein [Kineococcus radiotolerans]MBB2903103.1 aminoglycoside phosphotransferase (APT) family kinase protein [Kineococcus radiotolerans]
MSTAHDLGPIPTRLSVEPNLVQQLIADQFPHWADLPVRPVADGGWDNFTFHLGPDMSVRLPAAAEYALAVDKEHRWLPQLAAQLPLRISTPLAQGRPGRGYPFAWSVYRWLPGDPVTAARIAGGSASGARGVGGEVDPVRFALDLADFLTALQRIDATDGPAPGIHNWFRGGTLRTYDETTQNALRTLEARPDAGIDVGIDAGVDVELARAVWATALEERWDRVPVWFHGDIAAGNLLLREGRLGAVIDFGTCGVGDPACDLAAAWTLLDTAGRQAFRDRLGVDDGTWARGRGWALWKTLATYTGVLDGDAEAAATARRVLEAIFDEYETAS